jgi:hypothetical protein
VLALRRSPLFWIPAIAIKIAPVAGIVYLVAAGRVQEAVRVSLIGTVVLAISLFMSPDAWRSFVDVVVTRGDTTGASLIPIPFIIRFLVALAISAVAGKIGGRRGEALVIVAIVVGNPTLWMTAFSMLIAIVPLVRRPLPEAGRSGLRGAGTQPVAVRR